MNHLLGWTGIAVGLLGSVGGIGSLALGLRYRQHDLLRSARWWAWAVVAGAVLAVVAMERALLTGDFSVSYVAEHASTRTPFPFDVATLWAALEGSILLWVLILAGYVALTVHRFRDRFDDRLVATAVLVELVVCLFFFVLLVGPASPFGVVDPAPADGPGPNPLLQNHPLMAIHPPMLYLGYVGFTVPFAFAVAALVTGRTGEGWLLETRRWTLAAWGFLTVGIVLGAWWSYEVLGWGGYWAWDPVENASLLPWLTGTAYLHSVMVQERRGLLRVWNLSLVCATFALTILGTFLTRSGVAQSVHAFTESAIGPWLLAFLAVIVLGTVALVAWRAGALWSEGGRIDSPVSREGAFLANNVAFAVFAAVVLVGTTWPLVVEALNDERLTVGSPFFEALTMPVGMVLLLLMAVAPVLPWRRSSADLLRERLIVPSVLATVVVVGCVALGVRGRVTLVAFGLGAFAGAAAARQIVLAVRRTGPWRGLTGRTNGGMVVHLGVVVVAVAIAASQAFVTHDEFALSPGETATISGHTVRYEGWATVEEPERVASVARVRLDGEIWEPAVSVYPFAGSMSVGTPSTRTGLREDVQLTFVQVPETRDGEAVIGVTVQPMVLWLWIGGGIMALGTAASMVGGRRRAVRSAAAAPADVGADADEASEPVGVA